MTSPPALGRQAIRHGWPWALLAVALVWVAVLRIPLIVNTRTHLDSDLAVDGLTLRDAVEGHWRWHYPGTPYMGILPVLFSYPQALIWGATPITLVTGGAIAFAGLVLATFLLTRRVFGTAAAAWGLAPLVFASTGAIWLSGRVTGGHLTAAAWHAGAFLLLARLLDRGRRADALGFGVWCGLGLSIDSLFLMSLAGLLPVAFAGWWVSGRARSGIVCALVFGLGLAVGILPREIGARVDPHDAYREQFDPIFRRDVVEGHAKILALDCLPRLIAGHRLPGFQSDPDPWALSSPAPQGTKGDLGVFGVANTVVGLTLFVLAIGTLAVPGPSTRPIPERAVRFGLLLSALVTVVGFLVNRNIFNSDNYRYLVAFLVPWSVGFGVLMQGLARRGRGGQAAAMLGSAALAIFMTIDAARWYHRFGWIDDRGRPVRSAPRDPVLDWVESHDEVDSFLGGYWDVYRVSFLSPRRVRGIPYPVYPNRFPEWTPPSANGHPGIVVARPSPEGNAFVSRALQDGGRVLHRARGLIVVTWP